MIQSIINELKGSKELLEHYELSGQLHSALISSGSYRTYQKGRINIVIFNEDGNPLFFLKFYKDKQTNPLIEHEFEKQLFLCSTYKNLKIPKPLALLHINRFSIMVEEAFNGKTLSRLLSENPSIENVIDAIEYGKKVQADLNDTLLVSRFSDFEHEVNDLVHAFTSLYKPTPFEESLIKRYTDILKEEFKDKPIYKRYTNGDFVPKNIILSGDRLPALIDFEFMEETHLYFLDWFRFFTYYFNVPLEIMHHILEHDFDDYFLNAALFKFRDQKELVNDPTIGVLWLVFYLKDFIIKSSVMPDQQLKKEREDLRSTLSSLLASVFTQDHEIIDLIRDDHIKGLETGLQEREQQISELTGAVRGKEEQILHLEEQIDDIFRQLKEKEQLINELNVAVHGKDEQILHLRGKITNIADQLKEKEQLISELNGAVHGKDEQIQHLEGQITNFSSQLKEKERQIDELDVAVQGKDAQMRDFKGQIADISDQFDGKEQQINELNGAVQDKDARILNFEGQITSISGQLKDKEERIRDLDIAYLKRNTELNSIKSSVTWRIVMKWHSLVEWLMPPMTRRRRWYDLSIIGLRTITNEGWMSFWWKIRLFSKQKKVELHNHDIPIKKNEPREEELERMRGECKNFEYKPKISIITPVWNTEERWLRKAIESIINQVYDNWEFCIANGGSTEPHVKKVLQKYAKNDKRIQVMFLPKNEGIAGNSNAALTLATGEFVGFLDHDDELTPDALYEIVKLLNVRHDADLIYSDHAKIDGSGKVYDHEFKPDWSPELLFSYCYIGHLKVIKKRILNEVGLLRSEYDGSQDYDLSLRIVEKTDRIYHVPKILYLWRATHQSVAQTAFSKPYSIERGRMAVAAALERRGISGVVVVPEFALKNNLGIYKINFEIKNKEKVTIIIPTKDNIEFLRRCINSIESKTTYDNYEILIIDNGSEQKETLQFFEKLKSKHNIIRFNTDRFNFSKIVNFSVSQADSDVVVLLNDDTEIISPNWIEEMLGWLQSDEKIGAVGCKLIYKDGRIQHAGVVLGMCGLPADHAFKLRHYEDGGYLNYTNVVRNYSAVTAACLMSRKKIFENIGGFNEENLPITYNDTDFCLRLIKNGYRVVYTPYAILYHHEGGSRGKGPGMDSPDEIHFFEDNWEDLIFNDPYYNKNLSHLSHNFTFKTEDDKILLVSHNLNTEGAPIFLLDLAKSLRSRGYSVKVVSLLDGPLKLDFAKYGIRAQICKPANIAKILKFYKPRVAIINTIVSYEYLNEIEKFGTNVNTIWIIHESERTVYFRELKGLNPSLFRKADAVVFVSNATKEVYSDLELNKNFFTIYNGINTKEIDLFKKSHDKDKLKQELGFLKDDKLITIVGTTCHRKGQKVFVNAAIKILKEEENRNIQFLIVGARENTYEEKKYLEEIKEIISKNSLKFNIPIIYSNNIPKREDIFKYYFISDIFVCTSFVESLPIVILEAMAFELPIISTDVFGVKEEIEHENSGILIKPGDYEELANKILYILNDESIAKKIGYNAYLRVKNCFYIKKMVDGYEEIIRKM